MAKSPSLRASDSDREHVAEQLRCATAEGRLSANELDERLEVLFAARTYGELDALLADLPVSRSPRRERVLAARWAGAAGGALALALLGRRAIERAHSGAAAIAGAGHPRQVRFPGSLVDPYPGVTVAASIVRLTYGFAGTRRSTLGADALEGHLRHMKGADDALRPVWSVASPALLSRELRAYRAVAAALIETELPPRPTASRLASVGTSGGAHD